jgi:hypothetical protein
MGRHNGRITMTKEYTAEDLVQDTLLYAGASGKDMPIRISDAEGNIYKVLSLYTDENEKTIWIDVEYEDDLEEEEEVKE